MSDIAIKVENLSKLYQLGAARSGSLRESVVDKWNLLTGRKERATEEFWALKDVSFEVRQGEAVGIIGKNGAGKSTLLKLLSRITQPTKGRIEINGRIASLLEVGTGFHPELTGRENVYLNGAILGMSRREVRSKFDQIVDFSDVGKFIDTPVKFYSSGMYVRLAFAVAAHLEPEILIIDEVLAVGDAEFQKKCLGKMGEVTGQGRTVLFVSHHMASVQKLCQSGVLLKQGKVQCQGKIGQIIDQYLDSGSSKQAMFNVPVPAHSEQLPGYAYRVQVEDNEGNLQFETPAGATVQIRVFFRLSRPVKHFVIGLGISSLAGVPIRTSWSQPKDFAPGDYEVLFRDKHIMLATGKYEIAVGLSGGGRAFQYIERVADFLISDATTLAEEERVINTSSSLIINQMDAVIRPAGMAVLN